MLIACLIVLLLFWPLGLGAIVLPWMGLCWALWEFAPELVPEHGEPVWLMLFVASVPLCAGIAAILVERISGLVEGIRSLRQVAALSSLVLLASHAVWSDFLFRGMMHTGTNISPAASGALLLALGNAVVFCSVLSALAVTVTQYVVRWGVVCGFRMSAMKLTLPWTAITLLGAVVIVTFLGQQLSAFFWQEFSAVN